MNAVSKLNQLGTQHPEWTPWLRVLREVVTECPRGREHAELPGAQAPRGLDPLLAGAVLRPDASAITRWLGRLMQVAAAEGLRAVVGQQPTAELVPTEDALALFLLAVNGDLAQALLHGMPPGASAQGWQSLVQVLSTPWLRACARQWEGQGEGSWSQGYCPVCAAWPAFAEVRGIARTRHLRCGRCGAGWAMPALACTYCGETDHEALGTLVVDDPLARFTVETCRRCSGYLKSCTTLQATPPEEILVTDLASVEYDVAAVERGWRRAPGLGVPLRARLDSARAAAPQLSGGWS